MISSTKVHNLNTLSPTGFAFSLQRCPNVSWFVQTTNLPGVTLGDASKNYATGRAAIPGDNLEYNEFELEFIVDESLNNWREIYNWMRGLAPTSFDESSKYKELKNSEFGIVSDGTLIIMTNGNNPNITVSFKDLFPLTLSDIRFDTSSSDVETLKATVSFRYTYYNISVNKNLNNKYTPDSVL